jgi:hypothetical protein
MKEKIMTYFEDVTPNVRRTNNERNDPKQGERVGSGPGRFFKSQRI